MNPINELLQHRRYINWADVHEQYALRNDIIALGIPGLIDVQFKETASSFRIIPVFETEKDFMWYNLKYDNSL